MGFDPMTEDEDLLQQYGDRAPAADIIPPQALAPVAPTPAPAPMNPLVKDHLMQKFNLGDYSDENRKALVDKQNDYDTTGAISGALASIAAGFQGKDSLAAVGDVMKRRQALKENELNQFDKGRANKIQDYSLNRELTKDTREDAEREDFNSLTSDRAKVVQDMLVKDYGMDPQVAAKITPKMAEERIPGIKFKTENALKERHLNNEELRYKTMRENQQDGRAAKLDMLDARDAQKLSADLSKGWAAKGGQAGMVQNKILAAEAAEQLLEQAKTQPGGLDSRQIEELAQSTSRLLGGGAQASARVDALVPKTFWGNQQKLVEYLSNKPTGAGLEDFTKRMAETIRREKDLATDQKRQYQVEMLPGYSRFRKNNPDAFNEVINAKGLSPDMIDPKGVYKKPSDPGADPDAQKFAKMHGLPYEQALDIITKRKADRGE